MSLNVFLSEDTTFYGEKRDEDSYYSRGSPKDETVFFLIPHSYGMNLMYSANIFSCIHYFRLQPFKIHGYKIKCTPAPDIFGL